MTTLVLRFDKPWIVSTSPLVLRFTDDPIPEVPEVPISAGTIGMMCGLGIAIGQSVAQQLTIASATESYGIMLELQWQVNYVKQLLTAKWQAKALMGITASVVWRWNNLVPCKADLLWLVPDSHSVQAASLWLSPEAAQTMVEMPWRQPKATTQIIGLGLLQGDLAATEVRLAYSDILGSGDMQGITWGPHAARWVCSSKYKPSVGTVTLRFNELLSDNHSPIVLRFTPSPNVCYWDDGGGLIGTNPSLPTIDFKIPIEPQIRRSYLMQPQISCIRVSDGAAVVLKSVSIAKSRSQWSSNGTVVFSSRIDAERAANELLKISINGYDFYLLCESPSESKGFGKSSFSATCRGRLAALASPYKKATNYVNMASRSFIGLMSDIVANTGWSIASQISDFTIPANAFSYAAKTPAEALNMMASGIGAMLDVDDETQTITVIPQWPVVPWNTATAVPDVILHDSVILDFSEQVDIRPDANAVFVRGEQQGVAAKVKRFGTAGDNFCVDIVDKLITDNQAARMRGTTELANAGNKVQTSIRTKVLADLPPMRPGMLIGVRKGAEVFKSVCEAWSISATVSESTGQVTVNQTVTLLRNKDANGVAA
ncbi:hypothetical protein N7V09_12520 [Shewanella seohaensis]|uniref:hypothetical protein n=1 Tax=Shewanella seohaensis TaxID=755175 RepID=UPI00200E6290|nr:hypothetical protein [Shewanella seohaensis]MCL1121175.1 hypothetical protein [Shewanella seohaensis]UXM80721.1 hypothetical protein N7V09_12520 [Shewanella seohaensis]